MLKPFLFRVLVKPFTLEDSDPVYQSAARSGIVVAQNEARVRAEQAVDRGTVVAIGKQAFKEWDQDEVVKVGDEVYFAKYAGKRVKDPETGEVFLALNDEDLIVGIFKEQV